MEKIRVLPSALLFSSNMHDISKELCLLRRLSGLSFAEIAEIFNIPVRSLHMWASGQKVELDIMLKATALVEAISYINRGSASYNRSLLQQPDTYRLLLKGKLEDLKANLGYGNTPARRVLGELSLEEQERRRPIPPEILANALNDYIGHLSSEKSRPAKVAKRKPPS